MPASTTIWVSRETKGLADKFKGSRSYNKFFTDMMELYATGQLQKPVVIVQQPKETKPVVFVQQPKHAEPVVVLQPSQKADVSEIKPELQSLKEAIQARERHIERDLEMKQAYSKESSRTWADMKHSLEASFHDAMHQAYYDVMLIAKREARKALENSSETVRLIAEREAQNASYSYFQTYVKPYVERAGQRPSAWRTRAEGYCHECGRPMPTRVEQAKPLVLEERQLNRNMFSMLV
ncbi:MAG: hypothetical protein HYX24_01210 [Candidatus Aenigmarchaeota archaeon]|nr:hypothetical protein [Candidatus Aenigmarchaeota archaeon]